MATDSECLLGIPAEPLTRAGLLVLCCLAGMGLGEVNELIEFLAVLTIPNTNVGGYENTGWDLCFNAIGAATTAVMIAATAQSRRARIHSPRDASQR